MMEVLEGESRKVARGAISSGVRVVWRKFFSAKFWYIWLNPLIPAEARVRIGPAEMALTRICCGPSS